MENEIEGVATRVVDACYQVHRSLGPGMLESTYQVCLVHELRSRGCKVESEVTLPVRYKDILVSTGYRLDLVIDDLVLVENKSVQTLFPVHEAQLLTYLKLSGLKLGFLINWNVPLIRDGIKRMANGL